MIVAQICKDLTNKPYLTNWFNLDKRYTKNSILNKHYDRLLNFKNGPSAYGLIIFNTSDMHNTRKNTVIYSDIDVDLIEFYND